MNKTVLIADNDRSWQNSLAESLEASGFQVVIAQNTEEAQNFGQNNSIGLIVLNTSLSGENGIDICKNLRGNNIIIPLVFVAENAAANQIVKALNNGGDDFILKSASIEEITARIAAHLRRFNAVKTLSETIKQNEEPELVINLRKGFLLVHGEKVPLLAQEIKLLEYMYMHQGELIERDRLLNEVWGYDKLDISTRTIDVHIARLRQKMGDNEVPKYLQTVRGVGYRFIAP